MVATSLLGCLWVVGVAGGRGGGVIGSSNCKWCNECAVVTM